MKTAALDTPIFTLEEGATTTSPGSYRPVVEFVAPCTRHVDGPLEVSVTLLMFDNKDRFVGSVRDENERTHIGTRATWRHEVDQEKLDRASRFVYQIDQRIEFWRKLTAGEIPELPVEADGDEYYPWFSPQATVLEDRVIKASMNFWATSRDVEITYSQACKIDTPDCRTDFELRLLDDQKNVAFVKTFSSSLSYGQPEWNDTSIRMERKELRTLKFYEIYASTDLRGLVNLPATA